MTRAPRISIVLPLFNTRPFLEKSVGSVLGQSLQDIEVICVDDGSTDSSRQYLDTLQRIDNRLRVIGQENLGVGVARNVGLRAARGKWVYFLDSDDWIMPGALSTMWNLAERLEVNALYFETRGSHTDRFMPLRALRRVGLSSRIWTGMEYLLPALKAQAFRPSPCLQFLNRSFLTDNHLFFPEQRIAHDTLFSLRVVLAAHKVKYTPQRLFYRNLRPGSITTGSNPVAFIRAHLTNILAIRQIAATFPPQHHVKNALSIYEQKQWEHALYRFGLIPESVKQSLEAPNVFEDNLSLAQEFLERAGAAPTGKHR